MENLKELQETIFQELNSINLSKKVKQKMGLSYLSWAYAWETLKGKYSDVEMKVYTRTIHLTTTKKINEEGLETTITIDEGEQEIPYFTDGTSGFVKVGVVILGKEYIEYYPIMDLKNQAVRASAIKMTDVNKAIQRAFVKAAARHGLGLYIYAGEDLPEAERGIQLIGTDDFDSLKTDVTALINYLTGTQFESEMIGFVGSHNGGLKISQMTEANVSNLKEIRDYLKPMADKI